MKIKHFFGAVLVVALLAGVLFLAGCITQPGQANAVYTQEGLLGDNALKETSFKTTEEYQNFIRDHTSDSYGGYYYGTMRSSALVKMSALSADFAAPEAAPASSGQEGDDAGAPSADFSGTNNQVAGVDEADTLKTDGEYIYTITGKTVFIVKAYPGDEAKAISTLTFKDEPLSLFVDGDRLAVFGRVTDSDFLKKAGFANGQGYTFLSVFDVKDRANPTMVKDYKFEGDYNDGRMIDGYVYLISTFYPMYRSDFPTPIIYEGSVKSSMPVVNIHYFNIPYRQPYLVAVNSIDMATGARVDSEALTVEGYPNIYMSQDNLYITYVEYINEWELEQQVVVDMITPKLSPEDQLFIEKVKNTDPDILSSYEKQMKIYQVVERYMASLDQDQADELQKQIDSAVKAKLSKYKYMEYTIINRLTANGGEVAVDANGKVPGHILNQFSLDEYKGDLRIATTINPVWSRFSEPVALESASSSGSAGSNAKVVAMPVRQTETTNNLYVLDSGLGIIGTLEDLGKGEQIYSARFMSDRAYLVTFKQTDPFFVIDLKNPSFPKVLGELKLPGFSRYLHPYDKNIIIGIGRDATDTGRVEALKISLFDVSDVKNPEEIASYVSDDKYASSTAEWEHKAFLFSKEKNLLVIPYYSYDYMDSSGMNGAMVFNISAKGVELRGLIDHGSDSNFYSPLVERSLYIDGMLYTKSEHLLRVNALNDLSSVANVTLKEPSTSKVKKY